MVWRSVLINQPAKLKREHFSLVVEQQTSARVPFEDIAVIVLNHREITLTHPVLSACAEYGIGLYCTGSNHQPSGVLLPFQSHSRATRLLRLQLAQDKPSAKRAWATIVQAKISNQAACLRLAGRSGVERLESYARRVRSGDPDNIEAQAAAFYFPQLFATGFSRAQGNWANAALDYGYAIMRGACARALVAHGMLPTIGIFHSSEQNAFNLADDLIEPYRAIVDLHVAMQVPARGGDLLREAEPALEPDELAEADGHEAFTPPSLTPGDKAALVGLLNVDVQMPRGAMTVLASAEQAAESLARVLEGADPSSLELPMLSGLKPHVRDT